MLSAELVRRKHRVVWISADFRHQTKAYRSSPPADWIGAADITALHVPRYSTNVSLRRLFSHRIYARRVVQKLEKVHHEHPLDLVVASIPPLRSARNAMAFCNKKGIPGVIDVEDLWPEVFENAFPRLIRPTLSWWLLGQLRREARTAYELASGLVGVSPEYLRHATSVRKDGPPVPQAVFLLGFDITGVPLPVTRKPPDRAAPLVVVYMGKFGHFYDLETVVLAADRCRSQNIRFVCMGDGPTYARITKQVERLGLGNISLPGFVPDEQAYPLLHQADVGLVPYRSDYPDSIPTKPSNYLFAELAVVSSLGGSFKEIMIEERFGLSYQAEDPDSLARALVQLERDRRATREMGTRGAIYARGHLDGRIIYGRYSDWLEELAASRPIKLVEARALEQDG
jgi:glycosyltransferase involved in cell wall biosynthesis